MEKELEKLKTKCTFEHKDFRAECYNCVYAKTWNEAIDQAIKTTSNIKPQNKEIEKCVRCHINKSTWCTNCKNKMKEHLLNLTKEHSPTPPKSRCSCACHDNKLNKPYEHDTECCENMNGFISPKEEIKELENKLNLYCDNALCKCEGNQIKTNEIIQTLNKLLKERGK